MESGRQDSNLEKENLGEGRSPREAIPNGGRAQDSLLGRQAGRGQAADTEPGDEGLILARLLVSSVASGKPFDRFTLKMRIKNICFI